MSEVWLILCKRNDEDRWVEGVFSSEEKAEREAEAIGRDWNVDARVMRFEVEK